MIILLINLGDMIMNVGSQKKNFDFILIILR